jgi:hypothetical protein
MVEYLPRKCKALSSGPNTTKRQQINKKHDHNFQDLWDMIKRPNLRINGSDI